MSDRKVKQWITINGNHVPIYEDESKADAFNRYIATANESKKQSDIAKNQQEADRLNGKKPSGITINSSLKEIRNYYKDNYNINVDGSYFSNGNDVRFLIDSSKELDTLYSEFPQLKTINPKVISKDFANDEARFRRFKTATALSEKQTTNIYVNSAKFSGSNYSTSKQKYMDNVEKGSYPQNTTIANVLVHELGHKLEYIISKKNGLSDEEIGRNSLSLALVTRAYEKMRGQFNSMQDARNSISGYAGKNYPFFDDIEVPAYEETFAEAVSDFISNGSNAKPFSKQIVTLIKDMLVTG